VRAAAAGVGYSVVRILEETLPLERIDHAAGITREYEERAVWFATHAIGTDCPTPLPAVRAANVLSLQRGIADALEAALDRRRTPADEPAAFTCTRMPSSVDGGGDGCYVRGKVARGSVVSFYQGRVYAPIIGRLKLAFAFPEYVIQLSDSYMIDGINPGGTVDGKDGTSSMCGALCNHPPAGVTPNAMFYPMVVDCGTLPEASAAALRRISWYDAMPLTFDSTQLQHTVVLVALRDIEDEEVFVDYRFTNAAPDLPHWYTRVPREGEEPRWEPFARPGFDHLEDSMCIGARRADATTRGGKVILATEITSHESLA